MELSKFKTVAWHGYMQDDLKAIGLFHNETYEGYCSRFRIARIVTSMGYDVMLYTDSKGMEVLAISTNKFTQR